MTNSVRHLCPKAACISGAFLLFALVPISASQTDVDEQTEAPPQETIDEITVYGQKSLGSLRHAVYRAEDDLYEVFNSLNDDDEFDIRCTNEAPIGSRIKKRVCRTKFEIEETSRAQRDRLRGIPNTPPWGKIELKKRQMLEKMEALVYESPEMQQALREFAAAKQELAAENQRRCGGKVVCSQN